jgi:hypothetical protein
MSSVSDLLKSSLLRIVPSYLSELLNNDANIFDLENLVDSVNINELVRQLTCFKSEYNDILNAQDDEEKENAENDLCGQTEYEMFLNIFPACKKIFDMQNGNEYRDNYHWSDNGLGALNIKYWRMLLDDFYGEKKSVGDITVISNITAFGSSTSSSRVFD